MADGHTRIGEPKPRIEARLKVTGAARFPVDAEIANPAYGVLVTSAIARGRILGFDAAATQAVPGFLDLLTHQNTDGQIRNAPAFVGRSPKHMVDDEIEHDGQIVAMVVAETFEAAREAARRLVVHYDEAPASAGFDSPGVDVSPPGTFGPPIHMPQKGDAHAAFAAAAVKIEAEYETPTQHHAQIEPLTTTCLWTDADHLVVHEPSQFVLSRGYVAQCLGIEAENVHVISPFVGGGFGGKASCTPRTLITAIAAKRLGRPVKLVASRDQGFTITTYRAETRHQVKIGADRDGHFKAYVHEAQELSSRGSNYNVNGIDTTAMFYAWETVATDLAVVNADRNMPGFMRSPAELPYFFALESAVDELAYALQMDPVELRRINDVTADPVSGRPYTSRSLMQCYDAAAARFDWAKRNPQPGSMREGDWKIGYGCASSCYPANIGAASARIVLRANGTALVQMAFHDMGTGAYTILAQTAADRLGLPIEAVQVQLGDSSLPAATIAAGSIGTASVCNAVDNACQQILAKLAETAGPTNQTAAETAARLGQDVEAVGEYAPPGVRPGAVQRLRMGIPTFAGGTHAPDYVALSHGAVFVEVRVHALTGEVRVPRVVGAYAAGTIINARTATSQLTGGLIWGLSSALHEGTEIDQRAARYTNDNLADYLLPVNADTPVVEAILVPEEEKLLNPMGIKGVGELSSVGVNAAVANAIFHATGTRLRKLPVRLESLL